MLPRPHKWLVIPFLAASTEGCVPCSLDAEIDRELAGIPNVVECGRFRLGDSRAVFEAMRDCIEGAIGQRQSFRAVVQGGPEGTYHQAVVGVARGTEHTIVGFGADTYQGRTWVRRGTCQRLGYIWSEYRLPLVSFMSIICEEGGGDTRTVCE